MKLSASIRDEIRRLMSIHGMYKMYRRPQMKQKDLFQFLEDVFHGNEKTGIVSQVYQVVNGLPPFDLIYNRQTEVLVNNKSDDSTINATSLILKPELHQSEFIIMAGREITAKTLENTSYTKPMLIKGRKLFNDAKGILCRWRNSVQIRCIRGRSKDQSTRWDVHSTKRQNCG
jgi:hypothetical protein